MAIDTGAFVAGVGVLITLDLAVLAATFSNTRAIGKKAGRERVEGVEEQAQHAHTRLSRHLRDSHNEDVRPADEVAD